MMILDSGLLFLGHPVCCVGWGVTHPLNTSALTPKGQDN